MEKTIEDVKTFAWQQMDAMWHDNYGDSTINMVKFSHNGYVVVIRGLTKKQRKRMEEGWGGEGGKFRGVAEHLKKKREKEKG